MLVPDLPGWGRSPRPPRALDVDELADALAQVLDAEDVRRTPVVANSFGCQVALALAAREPERVSALVLVGPTVDRTLRSVRQQVPRFLLTGLGEPPPLVALVVRDYLWMGPRRFLATAAHALHDRPEERTARVTAPSLVVRGSGDRFVSQRWCEELATSLPRGRVAVVRGAHAVHYSSPGRVASLVLRLLEEVEDGAGER